MPAEPSVVRLGVGDRRVSADQLCLALFSVAGPLLAVAGGGRLGLPSTLDAGILLATAACLGAAFRSRDITPADRLVLTLAAMTWLALDGRVVAIGLTGAALVAFSRRSRLPHSLATLWLAIAVHALWAPFLFRFVGRWVIAAEIQLIAPVAELLLPGLVISGARLQAPGGWYIYVLEGCSAFAGLSASALVWFGTLRLLAATPDRRALLGLAGGLCGVVALNVARILLMVPSPEAYTYWHTGAGSALVVAAGIALGAGPALLARRGP